MYETTKNYASRTGAGIDLMKNCRKIILGHGPTIEPELTCLDISELDKYGFIYLLA